MILKFGIGNTVCGDGNTKVEPIIELWEEAQQFFQNNTSDISKFSIDASSVTSMLKAGNDHENNYEEYLKAFLKSKETGVLCHLDLIYTEGAFPTESSLVYEACHFLQHFYLAMNLCQRGGCHMYKVCFPDNPSKDIYLSNFNGHPLEFAWAEAEAWKWPLLRRLPFEQVWRWLEKINLNEISLAEKPAQSAAFALISISEQNILDSRDILLLSQTLESLFVEEHDGINKRLRERINLVLGEPESHKKWLNKFYDLRSRIIHGSYPALRPIFGWEAAGEPQEYMDELNLNYNRALAVIVAVLQDLILSSSETYEFEETFTRQQ